MSTKLQLDKTLEKVFFGSFRTIYRHVAFSTVQGIIWFFAFLLMVLSIPWSRIGNLGNPDQIWESFPFIIASLIYVSLPIGALIWGPISCAMVRLAPEIDEPESLPILWRGFRENFWSAVKVYGVYFFLLFFLIVDLLAIIVHPSLFMVLISPLIIYSLLLLILMGMYIPGLIVFQKNTVTKVFRKAFLLVMDNAVVTIASVFCLAFPAVLLAVALLLNSVASGFLVMLGRVMMILTLPFFMFFYGTFIHYLISSLFQDVLSRYGEKEE